MDQDYQSLFNHLPAVTTPNGLASKINTAIHYRLNRQAKLGRQATNMTFGLAFVFLWPALYYLSLNLTQTGLSAYGSLIWYDQNLLLGYWRELGWSLLESLPFLNIALVLAIVTALGFSTLHLINNRSQTFTYQLN